MRYFTLSTAIAGIFLLATGCQKKASDLPAEKDKTPVEAFDCPGCLPIAYVEVDSLLNNYNLARDLNEQMLTREENARMTVNEKSRQLEKEVNEFERKVKNNAFLSQERFEQEQQRLIKKQQELQTYAQQLENELMTEQQKMLLQVTDSITNFIKEYNKDGRYEAIFNNSSVLFIKPAYNITEEVTVLLNKRYASRQK
ncbi:MAG: OmpH family outer membrane protein [Porphyromonadaceae bacterium]|nr:OmpH family outer membrane protein [Porphyromonadaceae bacterium]